MHDLADESAAINPAPSVPQGLPGGLPLSDADPSEPLDLLRLAAESAAAAALAAELAPTAAPRMLAAPRIARTPLGRYPDGAILPGPDMLASVVVPAGPSATAVVSFEPEDALELLGALQTRPGTDPLARYCEAAAHLGAAILDAWLPGSGSGRGGAPRLVEDGLVATLLATHAPPDTVVVSLELVVASEQRAFAGAFNLLIDGKTLATLPASEAPTPEGTAL